MKLLWERYGWLCIPLLFFCVYLPQIAPTVTTAYGGADGGELATAVWNGGVPHPPGYPTYLLAGRVALLLPWGEPAWRLGVLSALSAAGATAIFGAAAMTAHQSSPTQRQLWVGGACTSLVLGFNSRLVTQALIVEVYPLALCCLGLLLWLTARWWRWHRQWTLIALGLVLGLGLGVQLPILVWVLGIGSAVIVRRTRPWRAAIIVAATTLAGTGVYSVLIWRGQTVPAASWGDWTTMNGIWSHITASEYRYLAGIVPWSQRLMRLVYAVRDLVMGLGIIGTILAVIGVLGAPVAIGWRALSSVIALTTLIWAVSYGGADSEAYLLPLHGLGAMWAGHGILHLLTIPQIEHYRLRIVVLGLSLCIIPPQRIINYSLRTETSDREYANHYLLQQPQDSIIYTSDDRQTFPLWYVQDVLGIRSDIHVVDRRLEQYEWYYRYWLKKTKSTP